MRLLALIARRVLWMPPTLFGLVLIVFAISHVVPSDPARIMAGENAPPEQVEALRHQYGLDLPLPVQFAHYIDDVVSGNMGVSLFTQRPVAEDLMVAPAGHVRAGAVCHHASLSRSACRLAWSPRCRATRCSTTWCACVTDQRTGDGGVLAGDPAAVAVLDVAGLTPVQGRIDGWGPDPITGFYTLDALLRGDWETLGQALRYLALPVATLALPAMATIVRFTRAGVLNVMSSNFVFYQAAMGIPRRRVVWKYILRSALIGTLTQIGLIFGTLIANAVVVEAVFDWPGLGSFAVQLHPAIGLQRDHELHAVRRHRVHPGEPDGRRRPGRAGPARPMTRHGGAGRRQSSPSPCGRGKGEGAPPVPQPRRP